MKLFTCSPLEGHLGRSQFGALRGNICIQVWGLGRVLHSRVQCCVLGYAQLLRKCSNTGCLSYSAVRTRRRAVSLAEEPACGCAFPTEQHRPLGVKAGSGGREAKKKPLRHKGQKHPQYGQKHYSTVVALQSHKGRLPGWPSG